MPKASAHRLGGLLGPRSLLDCQILATTRSASYQRKHQLRRFLDKTDLARVADALVLLLECACHCQI